MSDPLVTCLCITRNRRQFLPAAIECFELQTYANRELLIVDDGVDILDLIPADPRIRRLGYSDLVEHVIGVKRNLGCLHAAGEIICHWDDDDYSAPGRIEAQVRTLADARCAVAGYRSMRFTDGAAWWEYRGEPNYVIGTSLAYRRFWWQTHRFEPRQVGEDNEFIATAALYRQLAAVESAGEMMYARIHPGNTSRKNPDGSSSWKRIDVPGAA